MSESGNKDRRRIEAYRKELKGDPKSLVFVALAEALNRTGEFEDAAEVAQRGLRAHPDSVAGRLALAVAEAGLGDLREALEQIKASLIIDQDNPRALALMGSLLLQKGLAKRAVQFLSQAVKLDPDGQEYAALLKRAKRLAKMESPVPLPVARSQPASSSDSPWTEDGASQYSADGADGAEIEPLAESEHTVFDPDSLKKIGSTPRNKKVSTGSRPRPSLSPAVSDSELTQFAAAESRVRRVNPVSAVNPTPSEGPLTGAGAKRKKPKVGGSAAQISKVIDTSPLGGATPEGISEEYTSAAPVDAFLERATVDGVAHARVGGSAESNDDDDPLAPPDGRTSRLDSDALASLRSIRPAPEAPSVRRVRGPEDVDDAAAPGSLEAHQLLERAPGLDPSGPAEDDSAAPADAEHTADGGGSKVALRARKSPGSTAAKVASRAAPKAPSRAEPEPDPRADKAGSRIVKAPQKSPSAADPASAKHKGDPPRPTQPTDSEDVAPVDLGASGRPSTMFVDDAVWAIYGGERPDGAAAPAPADPVDPADTPQANPAPRKKPAAKKKAPAAPRRRSVLVVRTSDRFGQATRWIGLALVLCVTAVAGYSAAVSRSGAAPVESAEDIKGIAADMERGGLASLRAAEEAIEDLMPRAPNARTVLLGALADVHARTWRDFGNAPAAREAADKALAQLVDVEPTVEILSAHVALSTATDDLGAIDRALAASIEQYPDSAKAWLLRAEIAESKGRPKDALRALFAAREIHPRRRDTLLALARWHIRRDAHGSAASYYDELLAQDAFADDVEALLDRYVLGVVTGGDPAKNEAESRLAGLIREELPNIANDEVGRVSLAFGVASLGRDDLQSGLEQLGNAEAAFDGSARFKMAVGGVLTAVGEWTRAREQFEKALGLDSDNDAIRVAIARAHFAEKADLRRKRNRKRSKKRSGGRISLPFGIVRLVPGRFELVATTFAAGKFPEAEYAAARRTSRGPGLARRLDAVNLIALADARRRQGKPREAIRLLEKARALGESVQVEIGLGRLYFARKAYEDAGDAFRRALEYDRSAVAARLGLGKVLAARGDTIEAIDMLEALTDDDLIAPELFHLLAKLKKKRGDDKGALRLLERVARISDGEPGLMMELGRLQHHRGAADEAASYYRRALDGDKALSTTPDRWRTPPADERTPLDLYYLGRVLLRRSEKRGRELLNACVAFEEAPPEAHFYFGRALSKKRKFRKRGKTHLRLYLDAAPNGEYAREASRLLRAR